MKSKDPYPQRPKTAMSTGSNPKAGGPIAGKRGPAQNKRTKIIKRATVGVIKKEEPSKHASLA